MPRTNFCVGTGAASGRGSCVTGSTTVGTTAMRAHSRTAVSVPTPLPECARPWFVAAPHPSASRESSPGTRAAPGAVLRGPGGMPSWPSGGGFRAQLRSLAWLAQGPGRVRRTAVLTTAAAPRSARWCGGPCSVPATPATGSPRTAAPARVSGGPPGQEQGWAAASTLGQASERRDRVSSSQ